MNQSGDRIRALSLLRRGLAASPELRRGIAVTLLLALAAGACYRVDTYLTMYRPAGWTDGVANPAGWNYFPSLGETVVTVGMACLGLAIFLFVSRLFPVVVVEGPRPASLLGAGNAATTSRTQGFTP